MRVSHVYQNLREAVENIINALANRLTAAENWGPEGERGQVLMSNGPGENDLPPSFQDIQNIISSAPGLKGPQGEQGEQGEPGPPGADGPVGPGSERELITIEAGSLVSLGQATGTLALEKLTVLVAARAAHVKQSRIRIYGTEAARDADLARPVNESAISGSLDTGTGIATDLVFWEDNGYEIELDPKAILGNPDFPSGTDVFWTIDNLTGDTLSPIIELYHTPIEA